MTTLNPLANLVRFGFTPRGSPSSGPNPTGTDFRHDQHIIIGLSNQIVRFGFRPVGMSGAVGPNPTGTDFRHDPHILIGLSKQINRFGRRPIGTTGTVVITPPPPPAGIIPSEGDGITGGYFSRKKWHVLIGQIAAERAQARGVKNASQPKAIAPAGLLADQALKAARDAEESAQVAADLRAMTRSLQAAAGAKSLSIAVAHANEAKEFARSAMAAMKAYQEFEDDEEEAIALLLMH